MFPLWPETHVDPIGGPHIGLLGEHSHQFPAKVLKKLLVGDAAAVVGLTVDVVEEYQVDVARVVQLGTTELSESEDDKPGNLSIRTLRRASALDNVPPRCIERRLDNRVGQIRTPAPLPF